MLHVILGYWIFFAVDKFFKDAILYLEHQHTDLTLFRFDSSDMKQIHGKLVEDVGISSIKKSQKKITKKILLNSAAVLLDALSSHVHCKYLKTENL